jgi:hypothetical protein
VPRFGSAGAGAYYTNRYAPWLLKVVPYISAALPIALRTYFVYRALRRLWGRRSRAKRD